MASSKVIPGDINRRLRQFSREIAATVLLTLAACGFLIAAIYGGGIRQKEDGGVVDPVTAWEKEAQAGR